MSDDLIIFIVGGLVASVASFAQQIFNARHAKAEREEVRLIAEADRKVASQIAKQEQEEARRKEHRDFLLSTIQHLIDARMMLESTKSWEAKQKFIAFGMSINDEVTKVYMNEFLELKDGAVSKKADQIIQRLGELIQETYKT